MDGPHFDVAIAKLLEDFGTVLDVARQPVHRNAEHDIDAFAVDVPEQSLNPRTGVKARATDCIGVDLLELPALLLGESLAQSNLPFDRDLMLTVGGVAGVKMDCLRPSSG